MKRLLGLATKMAYVLAKEEKPMNGVDVFVITESGVKGVARYWSEIGYWLSQDEALTVGEVVKKWKYADAE